MWATRASALTRRHRGKILTGDCFIVVAVQSLKAVFLLVFGQVFHHWADAELLERERPITILVELSDDHAGFHRLAGRALAIRASRAMRLLTIPAEWRLGFVLGGDHAVLVGIKTAEQSILFLRRKFCVKPARLEFMETDSSALVGIEFPKPLHRRSLVGSLRFAHASNLLAAQATVIILVEAIEKIAALFLGQILNARQGLELRF
jgi:hypothetical protein